MNIEDIKVLKHEKTKYQKFFKDVRVLELGLRNINGSVRECFDNCKVVGVDWIDGKDVDVVCKFTDTNLKVNSFDILISYSTWEHDPYWKESISHNIPFIKSGGMVFFSWALPGSSEHGLHYSADIKGEPTGAFTPAAEITNKDPIGGYYPKSIDEISRFLESVGVSVIGNLTSPISIGYITGVKK